MKKMLLTLMASLMMNQAIAVGKAYLVNTMDSTWSVSAGKVNVKKGTTSQLVKIPSRGLTIDANAIYRISMYQTTKQKETVKSQSLYSSNKIYTVVNSGTIDKQINGQGIYEISYNPNAAITKQEVYQKVNLRKYRPVIVTKLSNADAAKKYPKLKY